MARHAARILLLFAVLLSAGCASLEPRHFAGEKPAFDPVAWFTGATRSWGVIENRAGDPKSRFHTVMTGRRDGDGITLTQDFIYEDGRRQRRVWHFRHAGAHRYVATAADVIGPAIGHAWGNTFHWEYTLQLSPGNPLSRVHMKHWMYLTDDNTLINRVVISKLGVTVAQTTEYFHRGHARIGPIGHP